MRKKRKRQRDKGIERAIVMVLLLEWPQVFSLKSIKKST